ncbi:hypothetical protein CBL_11834 [Carabus blaptoides fortunei]
MSIGGREAVVKDTTTDRRYTVKILNDLLLMALAPVQVKQWPLEFHTQPKQCPLCPDRFATFTCSCFSECRRRKITGGEMFNVDAPRTTGAIHIIHETWLYGKHTQSTSRPTRTIIS